MTDPVDIAAIAERLEVPKNTVNVWRFRKVLPDPDYPLAVGPVWEWATIEEWAKRTNRYAGFTVINPPSTRKNPGH